MSKDNNNHVLKLITLNIARSLTVDDGDQQSFDEQLKQLDRKTIDQAVKVGTTIALLNLTGKSVVDTAKMFGVGKSTFNDHLNTGHKYGIDRKQVLKDAKAKRVGQTSVPMPDLKGIPQSGSGKMFNPVTELLGPSVIPDYLSHGIPDHEKRTFMFKVMDESIETLHNIMDAEGMFYVAGKSDYDVLRALKITEHLSTEQRKHALYLILMDTFTKLHEETAGGKAGSPNPHRPSPLPPVPQLKVVDSVEPKVEPKPKSKAKAKPKAKPKAKSKAKPRKTHVVETDEDGLAEELEKNDVVFVYFWSTICSPCKVYGPMYESYAKVQQREGVFKMLKADANTNRKMCIDLGIRGAPTTAMFKNGVLVYTQVGVMLRPMLDTAFRVVRNLNNEKVVESQTNDKIRNMLHEHCQRMIGVIV